MANNQNQNQNQRQRSSVSGGSDQFIAEPVEVGLPWRLMIFTFILLLFAIFIFLGLKFGYQTYLDSQIESVDQQMEELAAQVSQGEKEQFLTFYSQLSNLREVIDRRKFSQNIFSLMENETIPSVYYQSAQYESGALSLTLTGDASSMESFVNQMAVYEDSNQIDKAILEEMSRNGSIVEFTVNLLLNPSFLNQPR